jgi:AhpD family alkylhydroperoxidase
MYSKDNLIKLKKMNDLAPEVMKAFWAFDKAAVAEGAIPVKYKELIAVAVAVTTQCPYCIDIHARKAGASEAVVRNRATLSILSNVHGLIRLARITYATSIDRLLSLSPHPF